MDDKNLNTKEKILSATIELYGRKGDITVREICGFNKLSFWIKR